MFNLLSVYFFAICSTRKECIEMAVLCFLFAAAFIAAGLMFLIAAASGDN